MEEIIENEHNYLLLKNGYNIKPESDKYKRDISEFGIWNLSSAKAGQWCRTAQR
jgi:hypothetical protein